MKHISAFAAVFGTVAFLSGAYFLLDYAAKEVTFFSLVVGSAALALHFVKAPEKPSKKGRK